MLNFIAADSPEARRAGFGAAPAAADGAVLASPSHKKPAAVADGAQPVADNTAARVSTLAKMEFALEDPAAATQENRDSDLSLFSKVTAHRRASHRTDAVLTTVQHGSSPAPTAATPAAAPKSASPQRKASVARRKGSVQRRRSVQRKASWRDATLDEALAEALKPSTSAPTETLPGKPIALRVTSSSLTLMWQLEEGGRPALDYQIEARAGRRGQFEVVLPRTGQSRPAALLRNLAPDTFYEFRVAAILDDDAAAIGPKSEASAAVKTRPYDAGGSSSAPPRGADASPFAHLTTSPPNSGRGPAGGSPFHHLTVSPPQTPGRGRSRSPGRRPRRHHHDSAQLDRLRSAPPSSRRVDDGSALAAAEAAAAATLAAEEHARAAAAAATAAAAALGVAPAAVAAADDGRRADARRVELAKVAKMATPRRAPAETADQAERERVANYLVMCATKAAGEGAQVLDATVAELGNVQLDRALRAFMGADVEKSGDIDVWEFGRALASLAAEIPTAAPSREARDALFAQVDLDSSGSVNWGEFLMAWPTILQTATHTMGGGGGAAAEGAPSGARGGGGGGTPRRTSVGGAAVGATVDAPLDVASRVQLQRTVRALEEVLPKATSLRELGNARPLLALVNSMGEEGLVKTAELFFGIFFARRPRRRVVGRRRGEGARGGTRGRGGRHVPGDAARAHHVAARRRRA